MVKQTLSKTYNPKEVEARTPHQFCDDFLGSPLRPKKDVAIRDTQTARV